MLARLREKYLIVWIPAFAGMMESGFLEMPLSVGEFLC